ncbi:MAG: hypothetical protein BECKG1743D_GA0114223_106751, partial [Candidatus Kentron sp. G]
LDVSAFPDATPLGLGRGVVLTQGSRFATTLGYDTQPLRGKEGNSSVAVCRTAPFVDILFFEFRGPYSMTMFNDDDGLQDIPMEYEFVPPTGS